MLTAAGLAAGPGLLAAAESTEAGPTGLLIIVLLGLSIVFLVRSMRKHLRRIPASFDDPEPTGDTGSPPPPTSGEHRTIDPGRWDADA